VRVRAPRLDARHPELLSGRLIEEVPTHTVSPRPFEDPARYRTLSPVFEKVTHPIRARTPSMSPSLFSTYMTRRRSPRVSWLLFIGCDRRQSRRRGCKVRRCYCELASYANRMTGVASSLPSAMPPTPTTAWWSSRTRHPHQGNHPRIGVRRRVLAQHHRELGSSGMHAHFGVLLISVPTPEMAPAASVTVRVRNVERSGDRVDLHV
jgi:hypothetical protein